MGTDRTTKLSAIADSSSTTTVRTPMAGEMPLSMTPRMTVPPKMHVAQAPRKTSVKSTKATGWWAL